MTPQAEDTVTPQFSCLGQPRDFHCLSDIELIDIYIQGNEIQQKNVIDEIVIRYDAQINLWVRVVLRRRGCDFAADAVGTIGLKLIEKLYLGLLAHAKGVSKFADWLYRVTENETISWDRERKNLKNKYKTLVEEHTISASTEITADGKITIGDLLTDDKDNAFDLIVRDAEIKRVLKAMGRLDSRHRLVMKLAIMFYDPLTDETISEIALLRAVPVETVRNEVEAVRSYLLKKKSERDKHYSRLANLYASILKLEGSLHYLYSQKVLNVDTINKVKAEIAAKNGLRDKKLKKYQRWISPTGKQMEKLLGERFGHFTNINLMIHRARRLLKGYLADS